MEATVTIGGTTIHPSPEAKYPDVTFDWKLKFRSHMCGRELDIGKGKKPEQWPDMVVLQGYTGHATSTTTGNHAVLYTSGCSNNTQGLLEQSDLENSTDILRELKTQGWLQE